MPEITFENDPTVFVVDVQGKGKYSIDAYALNYEVIARKPPSMSVKAVAELTAEQAVEDQEKVVAAARPLLHCEEGTVAEELTNAEVFAIASKVLLRLKQLGNE